MTGKLAPITEEQSSHIEKLFMEVAASPIVSAWYVPTRAVSSPRVRWPDPCAHEVDLYLILETRNAFVTISWERDYLVEGLAVLVEEAPVQMVDPDLSPVAVAEMEEWKPFIGRSMVGVAAGWHVSEESCPPSVWSLRFTNTEGRSLVVALGGCGHEGGVRYHPDSLLVIFDEETARSYQTFASLGSAWGRLMYGQ